MKRLVWIPLALFLLAGCSKEQPAQPTEQTQPTTATVITEPTEPTEPGLYVPDSEMEKKTDGAVRSYGLEDREWFGLSSVGADVLVTGKNTMLLLTGEQGWATRAEVKALSSDTEMDTYSTGVAYYDTKSRKVTVLNGNLLLVTQKVLPEDIVGNPVISMIRNEVYYFNGSEIRAMELTAGTSRSRLLRQQASMESLLPDDYFDGNVLSCQVKDSAGQVRTEYFSSETGQTYSQDQAIDTMHTFEDQYYIERVDIEVQQRIFGHRNGERQSFLLNPGKNVTLAPVLEMNGIVSCEKKSKGLDLSFYDLKTGKRSANVFLPSIKEMKAIHCDSENIWILAQEGEKQTLLCWDITKSPITDNNIYIGPFYSPQNPDLNGLQECVKLAETYESAYHVKLHIGTNAMQVTGDHMVVVEHQPQIIRTTLEKLEPVLKDLQPVFKSLANRRSPQIIQIGLVRSIDSGEEWVRFQHDKTWWFLISSQADVADALISGMAVPIESFVLGNSRDYEFDRWNPLNPKGFAYSNDEETDTKYLNGKKRAFVNAEAMTSISADRRSIIYNAMLAGNSKMFTAPTMQAKLNRICLGIREACNLQKSEETYLWEQYLETSLAYVK